MTEFRRESDLVPRIVEAGEPAKVFGREVPLFKRMMDLYAVSRPTGRTFAYELKLSDWKRGLRQASTYVLAADFVYLAIPKTIAQRAIAMTDVFQEFGVGLMAIDGTCDVIIRPKRSRQVIETCRQSALDHLYGRRGEANAS
jgi:hypothetical protein